MNIKNILDSYIKMSKNLADDKYNENNAYFISEMLLKPDEIIMTVDRKINCDFNDLDFDNELYITPDQIKEFNEYIKNKKYKLRKAPIYNLDRVADIHRPLIKKLIKNRLNVSAIYTYPILTKDNTYYIENMDFNDGEIIIYINRKKAGQIGKFIKGIYITEEQYMEYEKYRSTKFFLNFTMNFVFSEITDSKHHEDVMEMVRDELEASDLLSSYVKNVDLNDINIYNKIYDKFNKLYDNFINNELNIKKEHKKKLNLIKKL